MQLLVKATALVVLVVATAGAGAAPVHDGDRCPDKCDTALCPRSEAACPRGLVPDPCACCPSGLCGLEEGERCFDPRLTPKKFDRFGQCGDGLVCKSRHDLTFRDEPESLCMCKDSREACGTNNRTYDSICQLKADASKFEEQPSIRLKHWGPCESAPWITSGPEDVVVPLNSGLSLDCEAKGYPVPSIHWEFKAENGSVRLLPSDDLYVAVQVRGGPESYMETSWVQIVDLRKSDAGTYTCIAVNSEGMASASAKVTIHG
ncbi:insulin-like growth factor-binding protein-related protein 1 [Schistocerca gregaria]|uniref:insulin-like growth factor-binding protein-related protein 1 n=1 Tax=Schistocerca gregaria TaxID=7010 RepID=UPI00211E6265|nr:insulin-like growth factor-binding protein-related protein 1 [Schistocerca gregaria]